MKRLLKNALIWIGAVMLLFVNVLPAYADVQNFSGDNMKLAHVSEEKLDDGNVLVTEVYEENNDGIQMYATNRTKIAQKRSYIKTSKGVVLVQMRLKATFQYNGRGSHCMGKNEYVDKCVKPYTIPVHYSNKENNTAYGHFRIQKNGKHFITKILTLTCSKNGTLS